MPLCGQSKCACRMRLLLKKNTLCMPKWKKRHYICLWIDGINGVKPSNSCRWKWFSLLWSKTYWYLVSDKKSFFSKLRFSFGKKWFKNIFLMNYYSYRLEIWRRCTSDSMFNDDVLLFQSDEQFSQNIHLKLYTPLFFATGRGSISSKDYIFHILSGIFKPIHHHFLQMS